MMQLYTQWPLVLIFTQPIEFFIPVPHLKTKTTFRALKFVRMCQEIEICQILHLQYHGSINLQYIVKLYDDIFPEQPVQRR